MKTISLTHCKIPLIVQYNATPTMDKTDPYDIEIVKVQVRGTPHDIYDIMRPQDLEEIGDDIVDLELEDGLRKRDLMRDEYANEKD